MPARACSEHFLNVGKACVKHMNKKNQSPSQGLTIQEIMRRLREENDRHALTNERRRAYILTFGCQQNVADSEKLSGMCEAMG